MIDHLDSNQVGALRYPLVDDSLRKRCADAFEQSFLLREKARLSLEELAKQFLSCVGLTDFRARLSIPARARRFTIHRSAMADRFDSEPFAPRYAAYREMIRDTGWGTTIHELADIVKPPGRYKTLYVENETYGVRLLSGRQIAQFRPIGLKIMSFGAWKDPAIYLLHENAVLITADGRADENLADCAMVRKDRSGWAASGHVHRATPRKGIHPGLLYLACASRPVQDLMKSLATGSVVDALSVQDLRSVSVPYPDNAEGKRLGDEAMAAWDAFSDAALLEDTAVSSLEAELAENVQ